MRLDEADKAMMSASILQVIFFLPLRDYMLGLQNGELLEQRCWKTF